VYLPAFALRSMKRSVFANPHGLVHLRHGSCAKDVALLISGKSLGLSVRVKVVAAVLRLHTHACQWSNCKQQCHRTVRSCDVGSSVSFHRGLKQARMRSSSHFAGAASECLRAVTYFPRGECSSASPHRHAYFQVQPFQLTSRPHRRLLTRIFRCQSHWSSPAALWPIQP
jgi:hypothetical protein